MNRVRMAILLCFVSIILATTSCPHAAEPSHNNPLHRTPCNDYHGKINPFVDKDMSPQQEVVDQRTRRDDQARAGNPRGTLLLVAGDIFRGSPVSNVCRGATVTEIMNGPRVNATAVGDREFDRDTGVVECSYQTH